MKDEFNTKATSLLTTLISGLYDNEDKANSIKNFVDEYNGEALSTLAPRKYKLIKYLDSEKPIKSNIEHLLDYFHFVY